MNQLVIRAASSGDATLIASLSRETFYDTFAEYNTREDMDIFMREQFSQKMLEEEVRKEEGLFLLAWEGTEALGYVRLREGVRYPAFGSHSSIEIARIYARQASIGKGVGRALMDKCHEIAKEKNKEILWLGVWERNQRAIEFYTKWGFRKFAEHDFVLGKDIQTDWLMMKYII